MHALFLIFGLPTLLYHFFLPLFLGFLFIAYQIYKCFKPQPRKLVIRKFSQVLHNTMAMRRNRSKSFDGASLAASLVVLMIASYPLANVSCLEQDATLIRPVADLAKGVIKTVTLGAPLELNFGTSDLIYNLAGFTLRTGFPMTMPKGFIEKVQAFYDTVQKQVMATPIERVQRKSLANLKLDLDSIVDSIVEQVRQSPDGLYTNYLETQVNGTSLEEACVRVGIQLKAYGVDLTNYRAIAGVVLGVPLMPTVASTVMGVAGRLPSLNTITGAITSNVMQPYKLPETSFGTVTQLTDPAYNSLSNLRGSLTSLPLRSPLTIFSSSQPMAPANEVPVLS